MEYILISLFGGGTADWNDIGRTFYDWDDIVERAKDEYGLEFTDINTFYQIIMEMGLEELERAMQNYDGNNGWIRYKTTQCSSYRDESGRPRRSAQGERGENGKSSREI